MTWQQWTAARRLLYEEQFGQYLRADDNRKGAEYAQSAQRLRLAALREEQEKT